MEELRSKLRKRFEPKPRKVRFRISSAYSGRVLKQVYEDGSESEELEDEAPHRMLKSQLSESFRMGQAEIQESWHPTSPSTTCLRAQRINVFRDGDRYSVTSGQNLFTNLTATRSSPSNILNFGKIIIYTNNLRIIKKPLTQKEVISKLLQPQLTPEDATDLDGKGDEEKNKKQIETAEGRRGEDDSSVYISCCPGEEANIIKDPSHPRHSVFSPPPRRYKSLKACVTRLKEDGSEPVCLHCDGAGCVPCSLCHGSKLSMFANRFKESFRAIRCPGCDKNGVQPCLTCAQ